MFDGAEAVGREGVVDVASEVGADGVGGDGDAGRPLANEGVDVGEACVAAADEVGGELLRREAGEGQRLWAHSPDGGDPGKACELAPEGRDVEPEERAGVEIGVELGCDLRFDLGAVLAGEQRGVADEERGVVSAQHGDGVGGLLDEGGSRADELAEEDLGVGEGAAGGGVGGDGADGFEGVAGAEDELDGADVVERGDGAAGDDGELGCEGGDGDEAEVGAAAEDLGGALRGPGVVEVVAGGEVGGVGSVIEVPHERRGVEEVDGGDAEGGVGLGEWSVCAQRSSVVDDRRRAWGAAEGDGVSPG